MPEDLLKFHQWCISDDLVMQAYREAIQQRVRPGDVVLDLGAGTGILGFFACEAGASKVYAVEPSAIIGLVLGTAAANGFADRIVPMKSESFDVDLPERVDVVIASMLAAAGIGNNMLQVVIDSRERLLKPGGAIIPCALEPSFCPVTLPHWYEKRINCWSERRSGLDFGSVRDVAVNTAAGTGITKDALLAVPQSIGEVSLGTLQSSSVAATLRFSIERSGLLHGLGGWSIVKMADGIACSNSPLDGENHAPWRQMVLAIDRPVPVNPRDLVTCTIRASAIERDTTLTWDVSVQAVGGQRAEFHHSTFFGAMIAPEDLRAALKMNRVATQ